LGFEPSLASSRRGASAMSEKHEVRVHIDEHPYHSPVPTDGDALYALGHVKPGLVLYREMTGDQEDRPVPQGMEHIHLTEDEHFHSGEPHHREFTIIVNGQKKTVKTRRVSFEQVVKLAFDPVPANSIVKVTYFNAAHDREGSLKAGHKVLIKPEGTVFSVTETGES
jgi:Multiubiquitin